MLPAKQNYRLTPQLTDCNHLLFMQLELFFKIGHVCKEEDGFGEQDLTKLVVKNCATILLVPMRWIVILRRMQIQ